MSWLEVIPTLVAAIAPTIVGVANAISQRSINESNNELQLQLNEQNNSFQIKQKRIENYYSQKTIAMNNYFDALLAYINEQNQQTLAAYQSAYSKISMYSSKKSYETISEINYLILEEHHFDSISDKLNSLLDDLNAECQIFYDDK